jgi:hypothetical protein
MNNLAFILWMCLYPLAGAAEDALRWQFCERKEYSQDAKGFACTVHLIIYFFVAVRLWEGPR